VASGLAVFQRVYWAKDIDAMKKYAIGMMILILLFSAKIFFDINPGIIILLFFMMLDAAQLIGFMYCYFKSKTEPSRTIIGTFLFAFSGLVSMKMGSKSLTWSLFAISTVGLLFYHCLMLVIVPFLVAKIWSDRSCQESGPS